MLQSSGNEVEKAWKYMRERFGVDREELEKYGLKQVSGDIWIQSSGTGNDLEKETQGIRFLRKTGRGLKPTTYGLQLLDSQISKNRVRVEREELVKLLNREQMIDRSMEKEGYVALEYEGQIIGCGMYKDGVVSSRIPKGRGKELADIL